MAAARLQERGQRPPSPISPLSPLSLSMSPRFYTEQKDAELSRELSHTPPESPKASLRLPLTPPASYSGRSSDDSTHRFEVQQTAEILCQIADEDSQNVTPTQEMPERVCTEEECQSSTSPCMHNPMVPLLSMPYVSPDPPPMSAFQMAPWVIYPNPPEALNVEMLPFSSLEQQQYPSDQQWNTMLPQEDNPIPQDFVPDPGLWTNADPFAEAYWASDDAHSYIPDYSYPCPSPGDCSNCVPSPTVESLLSTLPPDTPIEDRRQWYNMLTMPEDGDGRFFGSVDDSTEIQYGQEEPWKLNTGFESGEEPQAR